jgi:hypothetical protein
MIDKFKNYKNIELVWIDAIKDNNGYKGCFMSHQKCIQYAKDNNFESIIVAEDDLLPAQDFENKLNDIINFLNTKKDWFIYLGGATFGYREVVNKYHNDLNLWLIREAHATHFVIYHKNSYDIFLEKDPEKWNVDNCWYNHFHALVSIPFIATQETNFSDITNKTRNVDYFNTVQKRLIRRLNI